MFEFTLANWAPPARVLTEKVNEVLFIYSVVHKMVLGFAIIGIINGVFIQETFKAAALDDALMVRQTCRRERAHIKKMRRLFSEADEDSDGTVDLNEWLRICDDQWVQIWLRSQDLDATDPARLFNLLDGGSGRLTAEDFIEGTARMKGEVSGMAIVRLISEVRDSIKVLEAGQYEAHTREATLAGREASLAAQEATLAPPCPPRSSMPSLPQAMLASSLSPQPMEGGIASYAAVAAHAGPRSL